MDLAPIISALAAEDGRFVVSQRGALCLLSVEHQPLQRPGLRQALVTMEELGSCVSLDQLVSRMPDSSLLMPALSLDVPSEAEALRDQIAVLDDVAATLRRDLLQLQSLHAGTMGAATAEIDSLRAQIATEQDSRARLQHDYDALLVKVAVRPDAWASVAPGDGRIICGVDGCTAPIKPQGMSIHRHYAHPDFVEEPAPVSAPPPRGRRRPDRLRCAGLHGAHEAARPAAPPHAGAPPDGGEQQ